VNGHPDVVCLNSGMLNEIPTLTEKVNKLSAQLVNWQHQQYVIWTWIPITF